MSTTVEVIENDYGCIVLVPIRALAPFYFICFPTPFTLPSVRHSPSFVFLAAASSPISCLPFTSHYYLLEIT